MFEFKYRTKSEHIVESILPIERYVFSQTVRHFNQMAAEGNLEAIEVIEVPNIGDTIDTKNLIARLEDDRKGRGEFFDLYCKQSIPLSFLAVSEGGLTSAIAIIQNENRGFVRFSSGDIGEMEQQKGIAKRIVAGDAFYIDGTSALILSETGLLNELYPRLPNLRVPQSVIAMLVKCKEKFTYVPGQSGYLQYVQGGLRFSPISPEDREVLQKRFADAVRLLESKPENIGLISAASKTDCFSEQRIPAELCDACVLAQRDGTPVLTEDYLYLQGNEIETSKKAPIYCSAFALMRVLCEQGQISFEKYLGFFGYLSSYRFRFLPLTIDDIEKAVFGDGLIRTVRPERIRWFNFPLTLSENYGVPFATAFSVVAAFFIRVLTDDSTLPEIAERIFVEILSAFPTDKDKRLLGKIILTVCVKEIGKNNTIIIGTATQRKVDRLSQIARIYSNGNSLWVPSK